MRQEVFHLDHTWNDIFEDSATGRQTTIVIDGLDSIRDAEVSAAFQDLIRLVSRSVSKVCA